MKGVYTFGEPRVGNKAFHAYYNSGEHLSWRVTHHRDPVPHLPTEDMGFEVSGLVPPYSFKDSF